MDGEESGVAEKEWSDVSPIKQARSTHKTSDQAQVISSPSRFAILGEDQDENEDVSQEVEEENEKIQREAEVESEEGEIVEKQTFALSDTTKRLEQQNQETVDGVNTRRTSARNAKGQVKNGAETQSQSTSNLASTVGKKRTGKKN